jgi:hypothetical protein
MSISLSGECEENENGSEFQQQQHQQHDDEEGSITSTASCGSIQHTIDPDAVDAKLAKEIDDLPFQERNDIYEEIHGVSNMATKETPQLIEESLRRLSEELANIDNDNDNDIIESKKYYDYAQSCAKQQQQQQQQQQQNGNNHGNKNNGGRFMPVVEEPTNNTNTNTNNTAQNNNSCYSCMNNDFRLRFLRCDLFNPKLAAKRICHFYNLLHSFFGLKGIENFVSLTSTTNPNNSNPNPNPNIKNSNGKNSSSNTKNSNSNSNTKNSSGKNSNGKNKNKNNKQKSTTATLMDFFFGEDKNDMILFKSGYIQCLPFRDRSGRKILVLNLDAFANLKSTIRVS